MTCPEHPKCDCGYRATLERVYGLLWTIGVDTRDLEGFTIATARKAALELIDKSGQARGIAAARETLKTFNWDARNRRNAEELREARDRLWR